MKNASLLFALLLIPLAGCNLPEDDLGIVRVVWNQFPWWSVVWRLIVWTTLGAFVGLVVGVGISVLLNRYGAYRLPWARVRRWLRLVVFVLNIVAMPLLFGLIGLLEGTFHSSAFALRHSVIGKEWLPKIAEVGADAIVFADKILEKEEVDFARWDEVHQQKRPIHIPRFLDRLDRLQEGVAEKIAAKAKENLFKEYPELEGEASKAVIDWTLTPLINYLLNRKLHAQLEELGVPDFLGEMRAQALKHGNGEMAHAELVEFLTERVLIRMLLYPLGKWVTHSQWATLAIIGGWFATPVLLMWLTRWIASWWRRRQIRQMCVDRL